MNTKKTKEIIICLCVVVLVILISIVEYAHLRVKLDGMTQGDGVYDLSEEWTTDDGKTYNMPVKVKSATGEELTVHNTVPAFFNKTDGVIAFHSFYQRVCVRIDGEEIYRFEESQKNVPYKNIVPKNWNFVKIPAGSAGKDISFTVSSKYVSFSNVLYHVSYGDAVSVMNKFADAGIGELTLASGVVFFGITFLLIEVIAAVKRKKLSPLFPFSFFAIIIGLLFCTQNPFFEYFFVTSHAASVMSFYLFTIVPIPYLMYEKNFVTDKQKKHIYLLLSLIIGVIAVETFLNVFGIADIFQTYYFYRIFAAITMIYMLYCNLKNHRHVITSVILVSSITCSYTVFGIVGKTGFLMIAGVYVFILRVGISIVDELHQKDVRNQKLNVRIEQIKSGNVFSQIETHFFYNNMGILQYMIKDDPERAYDLMGKFSKYMRYKSDGVASMTGIIDIKHEIKAARNYAAMKQLQLGDKLNINYELDDDNFNVPVLTVEPLVKCMIRLSVTPLNDVATIDITTQVFDDYNFVKITSDAIGTDGANSDDAKEMAVTFEAIKKRLAEFGDNKMYVISEGKRGINIQIHIAKQLKEKVLKYEDNIS